MKKSGTAILAIAVIYLPSSTGKGTWIQTIKKEHIDFNISTVFDLSNMYALPTKLIFYSKSPPPYRRHQFRDAKCAAKTFAGRLVRCPPAHEGLLSKS